MHPYSKRLAALMGTTCLGVAALAAPAAADLVFGFDRNSPQPPENIYLVDPTDGSRRLVCTFDPNLDAPGPVANENLNSPNGIAYDQANNRLYFSVTQTPNLPSATGTSNLYFCEPDGTDPDETATFAGTLTGESAGAAWTRLIMVMGRAGRPG